MSNQNGSETATAKRFALNDKTNLRFLREAINENLEEFAREKGITIEAANISYESDGCSCKVTIKVTAPNESGVVQFEYEKDWNKHLSILGFIAPGLKPEHLGAQFMHIRTPFTVVGLASRRRKFPIVARNNVTDKIMLFPASVVTRFTKEEAK